MIKKRWQANRNTAASFKRVLVLLLILSFALTGLPGPAAAYSANEPRSAAPAKDQKSAGKPQIAIIIDDFGNGMRGTEEMLALPVKFTVAVMPFLRTSKADAIAAHKRGLDVLVHLPMEPRHGKASWLGPGAVLTSLSDDEIRRRVEAAVDEVPYAAGINNHMGSKVTGDERVMRIVLSVCKERGLFFVDSRTNYRSVAGSTAHQMGLPKVENDLFLDDTHTASHVAKQLKLAGQRAGEQHYCITIGHVGIQGKETAAGIRSGIQELKGSVQFVGITDMVREKYRWKPGPTLP
ncbi:divergent polysaccharide deacetylase family protein [Paenibacillus sp. HN-1]|uniref:divergent polysaccharide deacetylase family protein n=1 Tax=Paenibacillus TaxID=44249 RepID=UPI001CA7D9F9|nr:divergent polysaccharide deacetylase family protein [Paenibacillus sp. CGMCC 1.18879]MBY9082441.1 divergent polysaccharide deacetylase family protein [Paenibacillus sp. CGMCC 1.18879]MBY9084800.1 divergent polysaccharide deacetylase family protein [Paenibacillus sinensis]